MSASEPARSPSLPPECSDDFSLSLCKQPPPLLSAPQGQHGPVQVLFLFLSFSSSLNPNKSCGLLWEITLAEQSWFPTESQQRPRGAWSEAPVCQSSVTECKVWLEPKFLWARKLLKCKYVSATASVQNVPAYVLLCIVRDSNAIVLNIDLEYDNLVYKINPACFWSSPDFPGFKDHHLPFTWEKNQNWKSHVVNWYLCCAVCCITHLWLLLSIFFQMI